MGEGVISSSQEALACLLERSERKGRRRKKKRVRVLHFSFARLGFGCDGRSPLSLLELAGRFSPVWSLKLAAPSSSRDRYLSIS